MNRPSSAQDPASWDTWGHLRAASVHLVGLALVRLWCCVNAPSLRCTGAFQPAASLLNRRAVYPASASNPLLTHRAGCHGDSGEISAFAGDKDILPVSGPDQDECGLTGGWTLWPPAMCGAIGIVRLKKDHRDKAEKQACRCCTSTRNALDPWWTHAKLLTRESGLHGHIRLSGGPGYLSLVCTINIIR